MSDGSAAAGSADREARERRREAERWLRSVGLPSFVQRSARADGLLDRVVPFLVFALVSSIAASLLGTVDVLIDDDSPTLGALLALLVGVALLAAIAVPILAGWLSAVLLRRRPALRLPLGIAVPAAYILVFPVVVAIAGDPASAVSRAIGAAITTGIAYLLTWLGVGAVLAWAARAALRQTAAIGALVTRALPILMLVIVFAFFSEPVWMVTSTMSPARLFAVAVFFALLCLFFVLPISRSEMKELDEGLESTDHLDPEGAAPRPGPPLSRPERLNLQTVLVFALGLQTVLFAVIVCAFLVLLGIFAFSGEVLEEWVGERLSTVVVLGVEIPFTWALVKTAIFLSCVSSLNFLVSVTTNSAYRVAFFHPLIREARRALAVRARYLAGGDEGVEADGAGQDAGHQRAGRHGRDPAADGRAEHGDEGPEMIEPGPGSAG